MAMHGHGAVSTAFLVILLILTTLCARGRAAAESDCLEQPGRDAPFGEHWYYHYDQQKNRKCWHLGAALPSILSLTPPRTDRSRSGPTLNSMLAPLLRGVRNLFRQPMPRHEAVAGEPRIVQSDPTRLLTIDDIMQPPEFPEERAEPRPVTFLTAAQRKALYDEYVKWETLQRNGAPAPAP